VPGQGGDLLQADPGIDQVLAEGVAQGVGREIVEPGQGSVPGQERLDAPGRHRPTLALKDHSLLAGVLRIAQGHERGPGVVVERHLAMLPTLAVADRQQALAFGEGDVLPRQGAQLLDPQPGVEQEPDDGQVTWLSCAFDGAEQGVLLAAVQPARPRPLLGDGPGAAPGSTLGGNREAGSDAGRSRPGQKALEGGELAVDAAGLELPLLDQPSLELP
jgi:hypothetical protein